MSAWIRLCLGLLAVLSGWLVQGSPTNEPRKNHINLPEVDVNSLSNGLTPLVELDSKPSSNASTVPPKSRQENVVNNGTTIILSTDLKPLLNHSTAAPKRRSEKHHHILSTFLPVSQSDVNKSINKTNTRSFKSPSSSRTTRRSKLSPSTTFKPSQSNSTTSKESQFISTTRRSSKHHRKSSSRNLSKHRYTIKTPSWYRIMISGKGGESRFIGPAIILSHNIILVSYFNHKYILSSPYNDTAYTAFNSIIQPVNNSINLDNMPPVNQSSKVGWPKLSATLKHIGLVMFKAPQGFLNHTDDYMRTIIPDEYPTEDCYAVKFSHKRMSNFSNQFYVYTRVPLTINIALCDGRFCYGRPVKNVVTPRNDLSGMQNSGVPVFCKGDLAYINMPRITKTKVQHHRLVPIKMLAEELRRYKYSVYKNVFKNPKDPISVPE